MTNEVKRRRKNYLHAPIFEKLFGEKLIWINEFKYS